MDKKEINSDSLVLLREAVSEVMPLLDKNLDITHKMYLDSEIPNGAYQYTLGRHANALMIASSKIDLKPENAFEAGAMLFIDLKNGMNDLMDQDEKTHYAEKIEKLKTLYHEQGYTAQNPILKIPMQPVEGLDF